MELQHLLEFVTLVKYNSFTKAAKELYISQPALTKHITALEKELGFPLLKRNSRNTSITEEGKIVYRYAENISRHINEMQEEIAELHQDNKGILTLASTAMQTHFGISEIIHLFSITYPNIEVRIDDSSLGMPNPFIADNIDLAFTHYIKGGGKNYEYQVFLHDQMAVVLPESHPLANEERIEFSQLKDETIICIDDDIEALSRKLGKDNGFETNIYRLTNTYIDTAYEYVRWKAGVCISSHRLFDDIHTQECVAVDLYPTIRHDMYLAKRSNVPLSREATLFWNFIKEYQ